MQTMDDTDSALAIMLNWSWEGVGRDVTGHLVPVQTTLSLSDAVNNLAFDGHPDAAEAMLSLLAAGKILATGSYQWRAYRNGHYQNEGTGDIPARRWQALQEGLALPRGKDWGLPRVKFEIMDGFNKDAEYPVAEWVWAENRFSTAQPGDPNLLFERDYSEELFRAWRIEVRPAPAEIVALETVPTPALPAMTSNRGRPPKWDWEGAMAHVAAVANTPDGLETGPGAQAAIERLMTDYFTRASNDASAPVESEIRKRASRIMKAIENLKTRLTKAA